MTTPDEKIAIRKFVIGCNMFASGFAAAACIITTDGNPFLGLTLAFLSALNIVFAIGLGRQP